MNEVGEYFATSYRVSPKLTTHNGARILHLVGTDSKHPVNSVRIIYELLEWLLFYSITKI